MKRAAIFAAALALAVSLTACGNRDNNQNQNPANNGAVENGANNSGTANNGTTNNGATNNGTTNNGSLTDPNGTTGSGTGAGTGNNAANGTGTGTGTNSADGPVSRSSVGSDLRRAVDGVGDAARDLVDDGRDMMTRTTSSFERMLDNARVHDTDGVLTDGENSRW